ncbi:unnamed protein product [Paramecium octaurelia]|uniref:Uncharacterized protein n=1 Tax=Paramecium octaurelia TaxID=43137 RepID=A0A8S1UBG0_PAROT|nr:unnamed protein product [Paramecium octaurelia]
MSTEQQLYERAKRMNQQLTSPENQITDKDIEKFIKEILSAHQKDIEEIYSLVLGDLKQQFHTEKKQLENYRDRAEKINSHIQQL